MWSAFEHRSGRVIAVGRLLLAMAFLLAVLADPRQPSQGMETPTFVVIGGYMLVSLVLLLATWDNWWRDHKFAQSAHVLDMGFFAAVAFLTEGHVSTPFFAIFLFLVMAAFKRFGWRAAAFTAGVALLVFTIAGLLAIHFDAAELRWDRFLLRRYYLLLLAVLVIWFALNHVQLRGESRQQLPGDVDAGAMPARQALVVRARQRIRCGRAMFIWADADEPWVWALESTAGGIAEHRFQPDGLDDPVAPVLAGRAFLFNLPMQRQLWRSADGQLGTSLEQAAIAGPLVGRLALAEGLAVPVLADQGEGLLVLDGIAGMCADDLVFAQAMAQELAVQLNRQALLELTAAAASDRIRLALARDIHDSVLQLLAALGFRLAALQRGLPAGADQHRQLSELADQLTGSQQELRDYVQNLRDQPGTRAARPELVALTETLAKQWGIACTLHPDTPDLELPASLIGEIRQLVREMVANAARHGQARQIDVALHLNAGTLQLAVRDNGTGFATLADGSIQQPWSLKERVQDLGGTLTVDSGPGGSVIIIALKNRRY